MSPPSKRFRAAENYIRTDLLEEKIVDSIKSLLNHDSSVDKDKIRKSGVEVINHPFPVCVVQNFICNPDLLKSAVEEVESVNFNEKSNDLYQFKQSDDLTNLKNFISIQRLYDCIQYEAKDWISKIFGNIHLNECVSATFSSYSYQDRLLCHDDKCGDRHIAFILYLVEDWNKEDGGALQLISADSNGHPHKIVKSMFPQFNTLVLFEVTHTSFHQVAEVLAKNKVRLSLNGWYHLLKKNSNEHNCEMLEIEGTIGNDEIFKLENYFSENYFKNEAQLNIRTLFGASSEIQLDQFLIAKYWDELKTDLRSVKLKWISRGPLNVRKYEVADFSSLPSSLKTLKEIFESKRWFEFLKSITALDLAPSPNSDLDIWKNGILPRCSFEIQRWMNSSYTLLHDKDAEFRYKGLDVVLRIPFQQSNDENDCNENGDAPEAGHIIYIDADSKDEECLLHIGYKTNSLALIFRDEKTLRFTKYLHSTAAPFYQIFCTYYSWRPPLDQPNLKHCEDESDSENTFSCTDDEAEKEEEEEGIEIEDGED